MAEGGLDHEAAVSGAGEAAGLGDSDGVGELAEFHPSIVFRDRWDDNHLLDSSGLAGEHERSPDRRAPRAL